jgi:hypothetical protein
LRALGDFRSLNEVSRCVHKDFAIESRS